MKHRYESHITVLKPLTTDKAKILFALAEDNQMKCSWITGDPVLGPGKWFYISGYNEDFDTLLMNVQNVARKLKALKFEVVREKIEEILYDTKTGHFTCGVDCIACLT